MDRITRLLGSLPRGAAGPVADLLEHVAGLAREQAARDAIVEHRRKLLAATIRQAALRDTAGARFERDRAIMALARAGWTNAEIARQLGISEATVSRTIRDVKRSVQRELATRAALRAARQVNGAGAQPAR